MKSVDIGESVAIPTPTGYLIENSVCMMSVFGKYEAQNYDFRDDGYIMEKYPDFSIGGTKQVISGNWSISRESTGTAYPYDTSLNPTTLMWLAIYWKKGAS
jgi:hypothetical protein